MSLPATVVAAVLAMSAHVPVAATVPSAVTLPAPAPYGFRVERGWLRMPDGVRLAVTYYRPVPKVAGERFPVLLEYLPYRKEDSFYTRDYPYYSWFVRRGFIMAKVDIRGTGSSEGHLPPREYSDEEMQDADSVIAQLARVPGANGAVGMWGISWGGFNAIQVAMRRPPALKAIIAVDATDDLYHDDIHYIDGVLHVDQYMLQIDHENALPAPPAYRTDSAYIRDRFEAMPWLFAYLEHSTDGPWWRDKSLRFHYDRIAIPCFLIGGLLDGYRDAVPRMLDSVRAPVKALIGPWYHAFPDEGVPGPTVEWRETAVQWWDHWLKGAANGIMDEPRLTVFLRDSAAPDAAQAVAPGRWVYEDWPIGGTQIRRWYMRSGHRLADSPPEDSGVDELKYVSGVGTAVPVWWGDATGTMGGDDGRSLVYDSPVVAEAVTIIGFPRVKLRVAVDAPVADWTVRLEDVGPDGGVALVTGALISGAQRESRLAPAPLPVGEPVALTDTLHFTTWTFEPGHRVRVAVANAQFPMAWPTPTAMTMALMTGDSASVVELPVRLGERDRRPVVFDPMEPRDEAPDAKVLSVGDYPGAVVTRDAVAGTTAVDFHTHFAYTIGKRAIDNVEHERYETRDTDPAGSRFVGDESHTITLPGGRVVRLRTVVEVQGDRTTIRVHFVRRLYENGRLARTRVWDRTFARGIH
jgi:predicted acyl esterase